MPRCWRPRLLISAAALAVVLSPSFAWSAEVHGRIWDGAKNRDLSGAKVFADCANNPGVPVKTDGNGLYRIKVRKSKIDCNLWVMVGLKISSRTKVYVAKTRTRANLELRRSGSKLVLVRR